MLSEDKYGEVVLERLPREVDLPLFQELDEVSKTRKEGRTREMKKG